MEKINSDELKELAKQLHQPNGDVGNKLAKRMNDSNFNMTVRTINLLDLKDKEALLELGQGNGGHLKYIFEKAIVSYKGLEISETMQEKALKVNQLLVNNFDVEFHHYNGLSIPFPDYSFDKIMTVNTIYFWQKPIELLLEMYRILKVNGSLAVCFADKKFMKSLPFVEYGFQLYDEADFETLVAETPFEIVQHQTFKEFVESKTGDFVERTFSTFLLKK
jgi:SAM-dependent methyltransferase